MTKFSQLFSVCHMAHCVKSVQTRSFFWSVVSRTQAEYEPENTVFGHYSRSGRWVDVQMSQLETGIFPFMMVR